MGLLIGRLLRRWMLIAAIAGSVMALGGLYAFLSEPVYQANILIKVDDTSGAPTSTGRDILSNVSPSFDAKSTAEGEMQILGSKLIVSHAVDALKLYINAKPHYFPLIGAWVARYYKSLPWPHFLQADGYAWANEAIDIASLDVPKDMEGAGLTITALEDGRYSLDGDQLDAPVTGKVGVTERFDTRQGVITLRVDRLVGKPGAAFDVVRSSRQDVVADLQKALQITEQGTKSNVLSLTLRGRDPARVSATVNEIGREYVRQNADRKAVIAANSLDFLQSQMPAMKQQMEEAEARYNAYRNTHTLLDIGEENRIALKNASEAEIQLLTLRRTRSELSSKFRAMHPSIVAVDEQIASMQNYLDDLNERVKSLPVDEQGALRLMREVRVSSDLYSELRKNIEELRLIRAGKVGAAQLIDASDIPKHPIRPIKSLILLVSALLGVLVGVGVTLMLDHLFAGVTEPEDIEAQTGLMVYATLPLSPKQRELEKQAETEPERQGLLALRFPGDPTVESLRSFRSALQFAILGARNNIVMLAGPLPEIGKSFVTANLATILAAGGKRVLLVDGDLRKGHLHTSFGCALAPGLAEALVHPDSFDKLIQKQIQPNLDFLQAGFYPSNPSELLMGKNFSTLMTAASNHYDIVLIDSAPALAVSDAGIMAPIAGSIFLVARFGQTRIGEIEESTKRFAQTGARVSGVLLNGFSLRRANYGHASRYGSHAYTAYKYDASVQ
ncbi:MULTISPECIES: polysaccharide biosynthesis tyrosine autokinase [unclassified Caballeronia]|uniref:polysaccharide biosynthesis tyrosine autokinase n=1 Tax=unclassified Caballeronia TaxID=2646786 RepID=UPI00285E9D19|nr:MULTISPECIES: polysaccharide biosynthesis tyrosine autokinase [unclassified Caballeronia]MDR5752715.1 polysaccharide biosynthesis tyrosine autokinase [Caballeronia sp. LZ024]MDR5841357.1 polysaccharide biosynthesis tyrosine autokinase [Caballeronia sp. LZ031]